MSKYDDLARLSEDKTESADIWLTLMGLRKPLLLPPYRLFEIYNFYSL